MANTSSQRLARFAQYITESRLEAVPRTLILYRGDTVLPPVEMEFSAHQYAIMSQRESKDAMLMASREIIFRTHATASMIFVGQPWEAIQPWTPKEMIAKIPAGTSEVVFGNYESRTEARLNLYPVVREGKAIRLLEPIVETLHLSHSLKNALRP